MRNTIHSRRGQTLVEAIVALSILTTGFIGIATLLTKSFELNRTTMNDTQATYLASEGIELVKNLMDHDVYVGFASGPGVYDWGVSFPQTGYYYDIDNNTTSTANLPAPKNSPDVTPLDFDPNTHTYNYDAVDGTPTNFVRNIHIAKMLNGNEYDVQSTVKWTDNGLSNTITVEDQFYNWHP